MTLRSGIVAASVMAIVGAVVMIWIAWGFDSAASVGSTMMDSNVLPIILMVGVIAGATTLIVRELRAVVSHQSSESLFEDLGSIVRPVGLAVLLFAALTLWEVVGFTVMSAAFGLATVALLGVRLWWIYAVAFIFGPAFGLIFEAILGVQL